MYLCADDHEEICHEGRKCPCCALMKELEESKEEVAKLEKQISEMEST